ncbi:MAG: hypothetical protein GY875_07830 [Gammaproteobacteria bacterium]|nr:hypothetical protein [Gammaproteobacteria bacterium]
MISLQHINSKILSRQSGVSMIELLVAMLLGLFLLYALVEILINGKQSFGSANNMSRLQENGRISTNLIITDMKRAGYMGGNSNVPGIFGTLGQQDPNTACGTGGRAWSRMISQPVFGKNDSRAGYNCIPAAAWLRGDIVVVRHAAPWVAQNPLIAGRVYLRSSLFEGKIFTGNDEADAINVVADTPQSVREIQAHAYYVGPSGRSCAGADVPSLFRVRLGDNGRPTTDELLPGIEDLQVQYGINGQYLNADDIALDEWEDVVTARVWILVRSECAENGFADGRTYTMGDVVYTPNDGFRRQLYSSVVMFRN